MQVQANFVAWLPQRGFWSRAPTSFQAFLLSSFRIEVSRASVPRTLVAKKNQDSTPIGLGFLANAGVDLMEGVEYLSSRFQAGEGLPGRLIGLFGSPAEAHDLIG